VAHRAALVTLAAVDLGYRSGWGTGRLTVAVTLAPEALVLR
jgi:hypothetical protein